MDITIILILQQLLDLVCHRGVNTGVLDVHVVLYEACVSKFLVHTFLSLFLWPRPSPLAQGLQGLVHCATRHFFYHKRHHGLKLHRLGKLDLVALRQQIEVVSYYDADEDMVLMRKEVLEVVWDAVGATHLEKKAPVIDAYLHEGQLIPAGHPVPLGA